jgi:hypothetical protein
VWWDTQVSSPVTIQSRKSAGFWIDTAVLNTHCEHNVAVTVAGELCPVIRFQSHTAALPFVKKISLEFLLDLYLYFPNIPRIFVSDQCELNTSIRQMLTNAGTGLAIDLITMIKSRRINGWPHGKDNVLIHNCGWESEKRHFGVDGRLLNWLLENWVRGRELTWTREKYQVPGFCEL